MEGLRDHRLRSDPAIQFSLGLFLFLALLLIVSCLFFLNSYYFLLSLKKVWELCWEDERLTKSSIMNGLRVPWAQYTLPFSLPLLPMGVMGNRPVISPTYTRLTMANYENFKLTGALGNPLLFLVVLWYESSFNVGLLLFLFISHLLPIESRWRKFSCYMARSPYHPFPQTKKIR